MSDSHIMSQSVEPVEGQPVLVAIDFSEDSKAALLWACSYSAVSGAGIVLLHIVHDPAVSPGFYRKPGAAQLQPMQDAAEGMMEGFLQELRDEHPQLQALDQAELRFVPGLPPSRIVEVSNLLEAALIVIGSRGITGLPHMLLGSVAERVVELSRRPVVVVKTDKPPKPGKKEVKRLRKMKKKERKRLKNMLGMESGGGDAGDDGG